MLYTLENRETNISYQFKFFPSKIGFHTQNIRLDGITKSELPTDAKVIGQLSHFFSNNCSQKNTLDIGHHIYVPIRPVLLPGNFYVRTQDNKYIVVRKPTLIYLFCLMVVALALFFSFHPEEPKASNTVSISDIKETETESINTMAYITGKSEQTINSKQPYVYLQNDEKNKELGYTFEYTVFVNEKEIYHTGQIEAGRAEQWDAYHDANISTGDNTVTYRVDVFQGETKVASSNITGLTITKLK